MPDRNRKTLLVISQVYVPDPASVGQHMHDAAAEMARRGWRVVVYTARRGYDDPAQKYDRRETRDGVEIVRLPLSSFGKKSIGLRLLAAMFFVAQCVARGVFLRGLDRVLVSTSPPLAGLAAIALKRLRRVTIKFWVMDLNLDQLIALGKVDPKSLQARLMMWMNRRLVSDAADIVVLDRYMADRLPDSDAVRDKTHVFPPWPHDEHLEPIDHADNPFRAEHGLGDKLVLMYSGNMGIGHPIGPLLECARRLESSLPNVCFMFIGGGVRKAEVERVVKEQKPTNVMSLPYQPLDRIKYSLSAADVHMVTMDDEGVGYFHPCKVYGAMAVARPILFAGPERCHVTDLIDAYGIGWSGPPDDVDTLVRTIEQVAAADEATLRAKGRAARDAITSTLNTQTLCGRFCDILESDTPATTAEA